MANFNLGSTLNTEMATSTGGLGRVKKPANHNDMRGDREVEMEHRISNIMAKVRHCGCSHRIVAPGLKPLLRSMRCA